jgi:hypothetical protein
MPAALAGLAILAAPGAARADLPGDAARIEHVWTLRGARVARLPPVFVEHGRAQAIVVPPPPEGMHEQGPGCVTVALVAVRTADFLVGAASPGAGGDVGASLHLPSLLRGDDDGDARVHSAGGAALLSRCGASRSELARVRVDLLSARAAVEVVVARSDAPLGEVSDVLPERAAGPLAPRGDTGGAIEPGPIAERLARAERRARGDGAAQVTRVTVRAMPNGAGQAELRLADGCHRVEVMAEVPTGTPRRATDVDAEARDAGGRLLARDRTDVPDARLEFCLGEAGTVVVVYGGAAGPVGVTLTDARWPVPSRVPSRFGPRARAGFAGALFRRRAPDPPEEPVFQALGVQGATAIPLEVQPGRCYLAAVALTRGEARQVRLSALLGDRLSRDEVIERPEGAAVAFCAESEPAVQLEIDARGNAPWWALSVWPMGATAP